MKRIFTTIVIFFISTHFLLAQEDVMNYRGKGEKPHVSLKENEGIDLKAYHIVDIKAQPYEELDSFLLNFNRKFNRKFIETKKLITSDKIISVELEFIIDTHGDFRNIKIVKGNDLEGEMAIQILKSMPKWKSALLKDRVVSSYINLPLNIKIE